MKYCVLCSPTCSLRTEVCFNLIATQYLFSKYNGRHCLYLFFCKLLNFVVRVKQPLHLPFAVQGWSLLQLPSGERWGLSGQAYLKVWYLGHVSESLNLLVSILLQGAAFPFSLYLPLGDRGKVPTPSIWAKTGCIPG